ncbi:MAG: ATP-binding cassette domain-containing protein [Lachnospiraceae bacterium]|nr:ATP-binding cassette domain-containing protein [Lachnospiraceae bacterium]
MITAEKVSFGYPEKDLYDNISFSIQRGEHCALIGSNGTGKSTLIDMIVCDDEYLYQGKIKKEPGCRIGYVTQLLEHEEASQMTVYDYLAQPFLEKQAEMEAVCQRMTDEPDNPSIFDEYQVLVDNFDAIDGYNYDTNIHKELRIAGLTELTDLPLKTLSGGEHKLVQIIHEMLILPDLLILDEPDVFLDFENLHGLVGLANAYEGTLLVVTHNRYLLYHCFNKILHLENQDLQEFEGSFAEYNLALLEAKVELSERAFKDQEEIDRQNAVVNRLRAEATYIDSAQKGRSLKAHVSYLKRLMDRRTKAPFVDLPTPVIPLPELPAAGDISALSDSTDGSATGDTNALSDSTEGSATENASVLSADKDVSEASGSKAPEASSNSLASTPALLTVQNYGITFDDVLLDQVSFELHPGEKIALVGPNGTGKTTLLRAIWDAYQNKAESGSALTSATVSADTANATGRTDGNTKVNGSITLAAQTQPGFLTQFYEGGGTLSGGEKNLQQFEKLSQTPANLLLLDEPTSHLDTYAQMALEQALATYPGAVLMVSHDFYMIANCADTVLYVENQTIRKMSGRAFRKMIYKKYFDKDYLELDRKKKQLEVQIYQLLQENNFKKAASVLEQYEELVKSMQ